MYFEERHGGEEEASTRTPRLHLTMTVHAVARCVVVVLLSVSLQIRRIDAGCAITPDEAGHVDIPSDWTGIGYQAFYECTSLKTVSIGNSVTSIGDGAFDQCTSLETVSIGDSVTSIGDNAFYYCTSLETVSIGNNVTSIGGDCEYR